MSGLKLQNYIDQFLGTIFSFYVYSGGKRIMGGQTGKLGAFYRDFQVAYQGTSNIVTPATVTELSQCSQTARDLFIGQKPYWLQSELGLIARGCV